MTNNLAIFNRHRNDWERYLNIYLMSYMFKKGNMPESSEFYNEIQPENFIKYARSHKWTVIPDLQKLQRACSELERQIEGK